MRNVVQVVMNEVERLRRLVSENDGRLSSLRDQVEFYEKHEAELYLSIKELTEELENIKEENKNVPRVKSEESK